MSEEQGNNEGGFASRFRELVNDLGGFREFQRRSDFSQTAIQKWMRGKSAPNVDRLRVIAAATGVRMDWLILGLPPKYEPRRIASIERSPEEGLFIPPALSEHPMVVERVGAGVRMPPSPYRTEVSVWDLWQRGIDPSSVALAPVVGGAMEPTLSDGDVVLLDVSATTIREGIWMFLDEAGGHAYITRITEHPDGVLRSSRDGIPGSLVARAEEVVQPVVGILVHRWRATRM